MKNYFKNLPEELQDLIRSAGSIARLRGMRAYLVGGFVRDLILGVKNLDLDIVVEGDGIKFAEDLCARLNARLIRHARFGTATLISRRHLKVDVATARKETYLEPAALPDVEFGSLKDDLKRRDFTINAMAINITECESGCLLDFFNGKGDLENKRIRVLHELSFIDDPTRILRAIRFEKRYNFRIETKTLKYLKNALRNTLLTKVQPQRLRDELILILKEDSAIKQIKRIQALAGFSFIKKGLALSKRTCDLLNLVEREIRWFSKDHSRRRKLQIWLAYFMALIDPLSIKDTALVCQRFAFRKGEEKIMLSFKKLGRKLISELSREDSKPSKIFSLLEPLSYETILLIKAKYRNPNIKKHIEDFLEIYNGMRIYISGHHLQRLGIIPGPLYQKIFARVLEAKLNGLVKTEEEELILIKKLMKKIYRGDEFKWQDMKK